MIDPNAVQDFLNEDRDDWTWIKDCTRRELLDAIHDQFPDARPDRSLMLHQLASFFLGLHHPRFFFQLDMGTGKTRLTLELLRYWIRTGAVRIALVCVPTDEVVETWEDQCERWAPELAYIGLRGSSDTKWDEVDHFRKGLIICTYPGLVWMLSTKKTVRSRRKAPRRKLVISTKDRAHLASRVDAVVCDESTKVANHDSLFYKAVAGIAKQVDIVYALAGRPFGRDPIKLWAQYKIVDGGESLGDTLGLFREAFYVKKKGYWTQWKYKYNERMAPDLRYMMGHRAIRYGADECIDLPKVIRIAKAVSLPMEATEYIKRIVDTLIATKGNYNAMKAPFLRMRQISSGFLGYKDDETGEKAEMVFEDNPKLDLLMELLDEAIETDRKVVVFHEFTWSGRRIMEALEKAKVKASWIWGGAKDASGEKRRFLRQDSCMALVINSAKGAYGMDGLQDVSHVEMFYESPVPVIDREQAERRLIRQGQRHKVFLYDLIVKGTFDEKILAFHDEGKSLFKALVSRPEAILKGLR